MCEGREDENDKMGRGGEEMCKKKRKDRKGEWIGGEIKRRKEIKGEWGGWGEGKRGVVQVRRKREEAQGKGDRTAKRGNREEKGQGKNRERERETDRKREKERQADKQIARERKRERERSEERENEMMIHITIQ